MLELVDVRVDVDGVPQSVGLSLRSAGPHVALLGPGRGVFEAVAGVRPVVRGSIRVAGEEPCVALAAGKLACASLDPPLPPKWTALEYVRWSARLSGQDARAAFASARAALGAMGLAPATKLGPGAALADRRAIVLAAALASGAAALAIEDPTVGLARDVARQLGQSLARATGGRALVLFAATLPLGSPLALAMDDAILVRASKVLAQGAPAELAGRDRAYAVRATGEAAAFAKRVQDAGGRVTGEPAGPMAIDLGPKLASRDLFALAEDASAVLVEVLPIGRAFS